TIAANVPESSAANPPPIPADGWFQFVSARPRRRPADPAPPHHQEPTQPLQATTPAWIARKQKSFPGPWHEAFGVGATTMVPRRFSALLCSHPFGAIRRR